MIFNYDQCLLHREIYGHSHRQAEERCHIKTLRLHVEIHAAEVSVAKQCPIFAGTPLSGKGPGSLLFVQVSEGNLTSGLTHWETIHGPVV